MISGININKSICNVIINSDKDTADLQAECIAYRKAKKGKSFTVTTSTDATIAKDAKDEAEKQRVRAAAAKAAEVERQKKRVIEDREELARIKV